jgi:hypothetical protein
MAAAGTVGIFTLIKMNLLLSGATLSPAPHAA